MTANDFFCNYICVIMNGIFLYKQFYYTRICLLWQQKNSLLCINNLPVITSTLKETVQLNLAQSKTHFLEMPLLFDYCRLLTFHFQQTRKKFLVFSYKLYYMNGLKLFIKFLNIYFNFLIFKKYFRFIKESKILNMLTITKLNKYFHFFAFCKN